MKTSDNSFTGIFSFLMGLTAFVSISGPGQTVCWDQLCGGFRLLTWDPSKWAHLLSSPKAGKFCLKKILFGPDFPLRDVSIHHSSCVNGQSYWTWRVLPAEGAIHISMAIFRAGVHACSWVLFPGALHFGLMLERSGRAHLTITSVSKLGLVALSVLTFLHMCTPSIFWKMFISIIILYLQGCEFRCCTSIAREFHPQAFRLVGLQFMILWSFYIYR